MAKELIFVRHGQTEWNVAGRLQGRGDSPLTDVGRAQVLAHLAWLCEELRPDAILASPLGRVRATLDLLTPSLGLEPAFDDDLKERSVGDYEGWTLGEIAAHDPNDEALFVADPWRWRPPGGENYDDMMVRTAPLVRRLRDADAGRLLVVSHGTIVRPILGQLLALKPEALLRVRSPNDVAYHVDLADAGAPRIRYRLGGRWWPGLLMNED